MLIQILTILVSPSGAAIATCLTLLAIVFLIRNTIVNKTSNIKLSFAGASLETNHSQLHREQMQENTSQTKSIAAVDPGSEAADKSAEEKNPEEKSTILLLIDAIIENKPDKVKQLVDKSKKEGKEEILGHPISIAELFWPAKAGDISALEALKNFNGPTELKKSAQILFFNTMVENDRLTEAKDYIEILSTEIHKNIIIPVAYTHMTQQTI